MDASAHPPQGAPNGVHTRATSAQAPRRQGIITAWLFEAVVLGVALVALAAIIAILRIYNGEERPTWPYSINLNSLVAILSTVLRAALMVAVAESISQMKWIRFTEPSNLRLMERFDDASRGSWGSAVLLIRNFGLNLASIGALVTISSLAVGPFTQQAIRSVVCDSPVPGSSAGVPIAWYLLPRSDDVGTGSGHLQVWALREPMVLALFKGFMGTTKDEALPITCATGNCTFGQGPGGSYASLGLCSKCIDVTPKLELVYAGSWSAYRLSGNTSVQVGTREPLSANLNINTTASSLVQTEWTNSSIVTLTVNGCVRTSTPGNFGWDCPHSAQNTYKHLRDDGRLVSITARSVVAAQCTLYPCARIYSGEIREGLLHENISLGSDIMDNYTAVIEPCAIQTRNYDRSNFSLVTGYPSSDAYIGDDIIRVPEPCVLKMPISWGSAFRREGLVTLGSICFPIVNSDPEALYPSAECDNRWLNPLFNNGNASFASISSTFDRIALAVTNRMRIIGKDEAGNPLRAEGQTIVTRVCIRVSWYWLIFPGGLAVLAIVLLAGTVVQSYVHRQTCPVWKSSLLPSLFYGLQPSRQEREDEDETSSDDAPSVRPAELGVLQAAASSTFVRFRPRGANSHFEPVGR